MVGESRAAIASDLISPSLFLARTPSRPNTKMTHRATPILSAKRCYPFSKNGGGITRRDCLRSDLSITFLGAHAIAPEYKDDPQGYTDLVCETMLPILKEWWGNHAPRLPPI